MHNCKFGAALVLLTLFAATAQAGVGIISTDRFGYEGTVLRFGTLADAFAGTNSIDEVTVTERDLAIYVDDTYNVVMGSWWYSTHDSGSAGWGNTHGNTGVGFTQLYDSDSSTDTVLDMAFGNFDGTYWTEFSLDLQGANANSADDHSRLSVYDNVNDGGIFHEYNLSLTATGLEGTELSPGVIEATNHPTGVMGSYTGVFELTENQTSGANIGFYTFDLTLNMENWAWDNRENLTYPSDGFADSYFATVPEPGSIALWSLLGVGGLGLAAWRRRK